MFCFVFSLTFMSGQVAAPRMDMTLAELQEMAARQQQQIEAQQQLLATKVDRHRWPYSPKLALVFEPVL